MFLAEDIMTSPTITIGKNTNVKEALNLLAENNISGVPVTDKEGKLIGIISGADIMRYSQQKNTKRGSGLATKRGSGLAILHFLPYLSYRPANRGIMNT